MVGDRRLEYRGGQVAAAAQTLQVMSVNMIPRGNLGRGASDGLAIFADKRSLSDRSHGQLMARGDKLAHGQRTISKVDSFSRWQLNDCQRDIVIGV
jgi:hypothetical protein